MPKITKELSALEVGRLKEPGMHAVGGVSGLYLKVEGNSRRWVFRAVVAGIRRNMGLGGFPSVTLAQAKEKARAAREKIDQGTDPIEERAKAKRLLQVERAKLITFAQAAERFIASKEKEWKNPKHYQQWLNTLTTYAYPVLGNMPVGEITKMHVIQVLEPIWSSKTETATRVRGRIENILDWAVFVGYRDDAENPARWRGYLDKYFPKPSKIAKVQHHPAVPYRDVPAAVKRIQECKGISAQALLFLILTAVRTDQVVAATWSEIDYEQCVWVMAGERMKVDAEHRVPLSRQAVDLLKSLPKVVGCDYVFPSSRGRKLSNMAMLELMRGLAFKSDTPGRTAVPHGFRSSFRDWVADCTNYTKEMAEKALAHTVENKTEAAYWRSDMLMKRVQMMQEWADYCMPDGKSAMWVAGGVKP